MKTVKFGVIGVGIIGRTHVECIRATKNASLQAVAEIDERVGKEISSKYGVKWYSDYKEMLEKEEIDAVSVCTPHFLHAPMTIYALKEGKHVLCEKPIAMHVKEADEMIGTAVKEGLKFGVVSKTVIEPFFKEAKSLLEKGEVGRLYRAELFHCGIRTKSYYKMGPWRGLWSKEGGAVMINQAIHMIDLLHWYLGKPIELCGYVANKCHEIEAEDQASALIIFEDNVPATLHINNIEIEIPTEPNLIEICGDQARMIIEYKRKLRIAKFADSIKNFIERSKGGNLDYVWTEIPYQETKGWSPHLGLIGDFVDAVLENRDPIFTGEQARTSLEIINAITLSHFKGKKVRFPIDRDEYLILLKQLEKGTQSLPRYV